MLCMALLLCCLSGCVSVLEPETSATDAPVVSLDRETSFFDDFAMSGEKVVITCIVWLENTGGTTQSVSLCGHFDEDRALGLVVEAVLYGSFATDGSETTFTVPPGRHQYTVYFCGTCGGNMQKADRLLPEIDVVLMK